MKNIFSLLLLTIFFLTNTAIAAEIQFKGIAPEVQNNLYKKIKGLTKRTLSKRKLDEISIYLFNLGLYEKIQIFRFIKNKKYIYSIESIPLRTISDYTIQGSSIFNQRYIKNILKIKKGDPYNKLEVINGVDNLKDQYEQFGYLNTKITITPSYEQNSVVLDINIKEDDLYKIQSISLDSTNTELSRRLEKLTKDLVDKAWSIENRKKLYSRLANYLIKNQYLGTSLKELEWKPQRNQKKIPILISIENPYKFKIRYKGNHYYDDLTLNKSLRIDKKLNLGTNPILILTSRIREKYLKDGFPHISIKAKQNISSKKFLKEIVFNINEGKRVRINKVELLGRYMRKKDFYLNYILNNSGKLVSKGFFNRSDIERGVDKLIEKLQDMGHLRAKFRSLRTEYNKEKNKIDLFFLIEEGGVTLINKINFKGNAAFFKPQLLKHIPSKENQPLSISDLEKSLVELEKLYFDNGYLDMYLKNDISEIIKYHPDGTQAELNFDIHEGPLIVVSSIKVEGNFITEEYVILNELEFQTGDILTIQKVNDSSYRLQRLGLFSNVEIRMLEKGTQVSQRSIIINVSEKEPGTLTSGIGLNTEFGLTLRGYLGASYRNLEGTARQITGRIDIKRIKSIDFIENKISAGYLEPYIFFSKTRARLNFIRSQEITNTLEDVEQVLAQNKNEIQINLEREIGRHIKVTWSLWKFESTKVFEINNKIEEEKQTIASMGPIIEFDHRDNVFDPTKGSYIRFMVSYADPQFGGSNHIQFIKINTAYNKYTKLGNSEIVWANSLRTGYLKNLKKTGGIPENQIFFLGGRSTLRGYNSRSVHSRTNLGFGDELFTLKTSTHFILLKSEFRFPLSESIGGVIFYDGGYLDIEGLHIEDKYRNAAGLGIRFITPVGPVNAEFGVKLDKHDTEKFGRFHLSIGSF